MLLPLQSAQAYTQEQSPSGEKTMTVLDYIKDYVDLPKGATDWKVFGATKEIEAHSKSDQGYDNQYTKPDFQPAIKALNGKEITVKGYMFPLDQTDDQKLFLFGPFPMTCPFQYHVGPALVLEVHADKNPVKFSYEPVTLKGTLELVPDDPEYNVFYKLTNARQVK